MKKASKLEFKQSREVRGLSPIERMIDMLDLKCCNCGAKAGECDCWSKCPVKGCKWFIEKGHKCRNPNHS